MPPAARADFDRAVNYMRAGNATEAELGFKQVALQYPQFAAPLVNLAIMKRKDGHLDQAEQLLKDAVEHESSNAVAWTELGATQSMRGEFKDAAASYHQAIAVDPQYAPEAVAATCGVPAARIKALAAEIARVAFDEAIELPVPWTDWAGRRHETMRGRPVGMHAMRGISAHSNGFQTCRALHLLQLLLGTIDVPGGWRYKSPHPKPCPPGPKPAGRWTGPSCPTGWRWTRRRTENGCDGTSSVAIASRTARSRPC